MLGVLCFDKDNNLVLASAGEDINEGDIVVIKGQDQDYMVTSAGGVMNSGTGNNRIVELVKYKAQRKKVG